MSTLDKMQIVVTAQNQASPELRRLSTEIAAVNLQMLAMKGAMLGIAGAGAAAVALEKIRSAVRDLDDIGDAAERLGVSTRVFQGFAFQLGQFGGDSADAASALERFANNTAEAARGSGDLAELFKANGVALRDTNGQMKTQEQLLQDFAGLVANAASPQERLMLAVDAFGKKAGPKMVEMLVKINDEGLARLVSSAEEAGAVIDGDLINKAGDLEKKFQSLEASIVNVGKSLLVTFADTASHALGVAAQAGRALQYEVHKQLTNSGYMAYFVPGALSAAIKYNKTKDLEQKFDDFYKAVDPPSPSPDAGGKKKKTRIPTKDKSGTETKDAFDRQVESIAKHIATIEADTRAVGQSVGMHERLRTEAQLLEAAQRAGISVTGEQAAKFKDLADRAEGAANALAATKLKDQITFDRDQFGRSESERNVASTLRSAGILPTSEQGELLGQQIRINDELKSGKELALDMARSLRQAFSDGKIDAQEFGNIANSVFDKVADRILDMAISSLFSSRPGGIFAGLGGMFGGSTLPSGINSMGGFGGLFASGGHLGAGKWGIAGEAGPEIIKGPADIIPFSTRAPARSSAPVINVVTPPGATTETRQRDNGGMSVTDIIIKTASDGMSGGAFDGAMSRYAARPTLKKM